ncbi:MAG TPA: UDP-N-acetylmuramate dehydrogenase [Acidimicrobiia bacterium]|jgi:UDP-N-acetylmuramate dehydrogenase
MCASRALDAVAAALRAVPGVAVSTDVSISDLTTYRLGGPAAVLARVRTEAGLLETGAVTRAHGVPVLVVGRGSNLLVADRGFAGVVVVLEGELGDLAFARDEVRAGGAVALPRLARQTAAAGLTGLEFYVGIPGTVGGAVRMNAGGHGRETREVLLGATCVGLLTGDGPEWHEVGALQLGYRRSALGPGDVVVTATFAVAPDDPDACRARIDEIVQWRREHQPGGANAGSVFRNPPGDSAGRLIESCGLKGFRVGGAVVSPKHANFFQAEAGATADDVHALVGEVRRRVETATGVRLHPELLMVGFDEDDEPACEGGST